MFAKQDEQFDEMISDSARRRQGIISTSLRRDVLCVCALVATVCALAFFFPGRLFGGGAAAIGFLAAIQWILVFKFESDLRLLRTIERLERRRDGPAPA
jgi:hypothetical protein